MTTTGTIVNGMVQLDQPVGLAEQSRVQVTVEPLVDWRAKWRKALDDLDALKQTNPISSGGLRFTRDELYERD